MFIMYDSVDVDQIPARPHAVLGYINGDYVTVPELHKRFPDARVAELSVTGMVAAPGYDIEQDDYQPEQAAELYRLSHDAGHWRPLFYAQLSNMGAVKESLRGVIAQRSDVRLMVADWNGQAQPIDGFDAHQFTQHALGRNLDESICNSDFFPAAKPQPAILDVARVTFERRTGHWTVDPMAAETVPA